MTKVSWNLHNLCESSVHQQLFDDFDSKSLSLRSTGETGLLFSIVPLTIPGEGLAYRVILVALLVLLAAEDPMRPHQLMDILAANFNLWDIMSQLRPNLGIAKVSFERDCWEALPLAFHLPMVFVGGVGKCSVLRWKVQREAISTRESNCVWQKTGQWSSSGS